MLVCQTVSVVVFFIFSFPFFSLVLTQLLEQDDLYLNNIVASAILLRKLVEEKKLPATPSTLGTVKATLKSFRQKVSYYFHESW